MRLSLAILAAFLLAGCAQGYVAPTDGPYDHSSVVDRDDQFVLSGAVRGFSGDHTYTWHTTHAQPTATWSGQVSEGSLAVTVKDQLGQTVYSHSYHAGSDASGSEKVQGTLMGDWTITVSFKGCTGSLYLVLQ
jgi:hypothetical protein